MTSIIFPWTGTLIPLTEEQLAVGILATLRKGATHYTIFSALKEHGVPVRADGGFPASQAATALQEYRIRGEL